MREISSAMTRFLRPDNTRALLEFTLRRLLPLSDSDLEQWREEPEEYYICLESLQDCATVRSAAESLFLSVLEYEMPSSYLSDGDDDGSTALYGNRAAVEYIVSALAEAEAALHTQLAGRAAVHAGTDLPGDNSITTDVSQVLYWDALYLCVGMGSTTLAPALPHQSAVSWWNAVLAPLLQRLLLDATIGSIQGCQILRMRLVWLLRCWFYHFEEEHHEQILQLIAAMLDPAHGSDKVVLLETVKLGEVVLQAMLTSTAVV